MEIKGKEYEVIYEPATLTVYFKGTLRLREIAEYDPIEQLLNNVARSNPATMTLNLKDLEYLNSSGITMLSMFVYKLSKQEGPQLIIRRSEQFGWQTRLLKNLKQMVPSLKFVSDK